MNEFDALGNWIQKGRKGTLKTKQEVSTDLMIYSWNNTWRQFTNVDHKSYYEDQEKEARIITYKSESVYKKSDSPNEVNLVSAIKDYFFLGIGTEFKKVEKYIKKNKIEHTLEKGYYGQRTMTIPNSGKFFYGNPITTMSYDYFKGSFKEYGDYSFIVKMVDPSKNLDFLYFLAGEMDANLIKYGNEEIGFIIPATGKTKIFVSTVKGTGLLVKMDWL